MQSSIDPTTARAEMIRETTGCSWEHACAQAEREEQALRERARPFLAKRGPEYDPDDWQTMPLEAIAEIVVANS